MRTASRMLKSEIPPPFSRIFRCKAGSVVLVRSSTGSGLIFPLLQNAISVPPAVLRIPSSTVTTQLSGWVNDQSPRMAWLSALGPVTRIRRYFVVSSGRRFPSFLSRTTHSSAVLRLSGVAYLSAAGSV